MFVEQHGQRPERLVYWARGAPILNANVKPLLLTIGAAINENFGGVPRGHWGQSAESSLKPWIISKFSLFFNFTEGAKPLALWPPRTARLCPFPDIFRNLLLELL